MSALKYIITLGVVLLIAALLSHVVVGVLSIGIPPLTLSVVFGGFWLLGIGSVGLMHLMGTTTSGQFMRFVMLNKTLRILVSLLMLICFAIFQNTKAVLPIAIVVFVGYVVSLVVESWYHLKLNQSK